MQVLLSEIITNREKTDSYGSSRLSAAGQFARARKPVLQDDDVDEVLAWLHRPFIGMRGRIGLRACRDRRIVALPFGGELDSC